MLNQNPKPYFNQVAMIESQYESKRRNLTGSNNASLLQNKSPLRERENTNSINTPSRVQQPNGNGNKVSLSPIRSRRNEPPATSVRSTAISRRKNTDNYCENHSNKVAKFMIDKDNEQFYFCERCAIPLISNGFKLTKMTDSQQNQPQNPRIKEINQFLSQLESMEASLSRKRSGLNQTMAKGQAELDAELHKIQQFYAQFFQSIDAHKRRVIEELRTQYARSSRNVGTIKDKVEEAVKDSVNMKQDILSSMNSVVLEVHDHEFRSVMNQYYGNLESFKEICSIKADPSIKDAELFCHNLIEGLVIEWNQDDQEGEQQAVAPKAESSQQYQTRGRKQQESERENPIECLETQERKASKELNGLFCSFDE